MYDMCLDAKASFYLLTGIHPQYHFNCIHSNREEWKKCMKRIEIATRRIRDSNFVGQQSKHNVILYSDNCSAHSSDHGKRSYARLWNIHERSLTANATHIQQPVDQHCGSYLQKYIQNKYWDFAEDLMDKEDAGKWPKGQKVGIKKKRQLIVQWPYEAVKASRKHPRLFKHSWNNFGLYLPMDGSKDGDITTIVR